MATYVSDQEQLEALKSWWKKNGLATVIVVVLGIALAFGVRFWQNHRLANQEEASLLYEQMLTSFEQHEIPAFNQYVERLQDKYPKTPYATAAGLLSARILVEENKLDEALKSLNWVVSHTKDKSLRQVAQIRAGRILMAQGKYDMALQSLNKVTVGPFLPLAAMVKGDLYTAQSRYDLAKQAYESAKQGLTGKEAITPWLQMKLEAVSKSS